MKPLTVLITGGAGFIGSNLVRYLLDKKEVKTIRVVDNLSTGHLKNVKCFLSHPKYEFIQADIRDLDSCYQQTKDVNCIAHLAALGSVPRSIKDPITTNEVNLNGSLNILKAAVQNKIKRVVIASSSSVYGDENKIPQSEGQTGKPLSPYAVTKKAMEYYTEVFHKIFGLEYIVLRYFNVFGPGQPYDNPYAAVIPLFCKAFLENNPPTINGDGFTSRDFTYVKNVVMANQHALFTENSDAVNRTYNIACGKSISLLEIVEELQKLSGKTLLPNFAKERPGDIRHSRAEIDLAQKHLGYFPQIHFAEGLKKTYQKMEKER